jgi:paraquat-inducible protein B
LTIWIPVVVEIDPERFKLEQAAKMAGFKRDPRKNLPRLIERGLRAQLQTESFVTGKLLIQLDFYPDKPARIVETDIPYPQIPTIPSTMEQLAATIKELPLKDLVSKIAQTVDGINDVVQSADLSDSAANLNHLMEDARKLLEHLDNKVDPLASRLNETLGDYGKLARGVDAKVAPLADTADVALREYTNLARGLDAKMEILTENIDKTLAAAEEVLLEGKESLAETGQFIAPDAPLYQELLRTMREFSSTARSIRALTDYLKLHPEALIRGKGGTGAR